MMMIMMIIIIIIITNDTLSIKKLRKYYKNGRKKWRKYKEIIYATMLQSSFHTYIHTD